MIVLYRASRPQYNFMAACCSHEYTMALMKQRKAWIRTSKEKVLLGL